MMQFELITKNERKPIVGNTILLQNFVMALVFLVAAWYAKDIFYKTTLIITALASLLFSFAYKKISDAYQFLFWLLAIAQALVSVTIINNWLLALLSVLGPATFFLFKSVIRINISAEGIRYKPYLNTKFHEWTEFQQVLIRDGLLTLDFRNNRLIQMEIKEEKAGIDELGFNNFCREQLKKAQTITDL
jgi:hypothetical protein